jgi:type I restriction enzyme S subunit
MDGEFGCYQWQGEPALLNQRVCKLTDFGSELLPKFLFYGINRYLKEIEEITGFTTVKHLSSKQIESIRFPVPPLSEQNRIVAILDQAFVGIDTAIANTEKNIANARELFDSYLTTVFNQHNAGSMKKSLSALCDKITVGHVGPMSSRYKNIGVPFLRSQNIRPFEVVMDGAVFIDDRFHLELKKSRLCPGDIAVVRTGYPGTAAVIPPWLEDANCSDLVIIRPSSEVNPQYLAAFFNSSFGKKLVLGRLVGAAQKHFNIGAAREVMLHYPSVQRQEQIVSELNVLRAETERLESLCQQKIAAYGRLKQSILQKAFAGELIAHPVKALQEAAE